MCSVLRRVGDDELPDGFVRVERVGGFCVLLIACLVRAKTKLC